MNKRKLKQIIEAQSAEIKELAYAVKELQNCMVKKPVVQQVPKRAPFDHQAFRDSFYIVNTDGRWHVMSKEDGRSKGDFDNERSAINHLGYICHMRERMTSNW